MEFYFNINDVFKEPIVEIDQNLLPVGFTGDKRQLWDTVQKVTQVVNSMGEASARAQCLPRAITTTDRFRNSDHKLYFMVDPQSNRGRGAITGMLKTGKKPLYVFDERGQYFQVNPSCILDFYVPETRQRSGLGKKLFEHMLEKEQVKPEQLAVDRPSEKLLSFLGKHYNLREPLKQRNNFVVYKGFFPNSDNKKEAGDAPQRPKIAANGLQYHKYAVSEPKSTMEQMVQNQQLASVEGNQQYHQQYPQNYQPQYQYHPQNQQQEKLYPVDQTRFNNAQIQMQQMSQSQPNLTQMQYIDPRLMQTRSEPNTSGYPQQYQQYSSPSGYQNQQFQGVQPEAVSCQPTQTQLVTNQEVQQQLQPVMNHIQSQLNNQMHSQLQPVANQSYNQIQPQPNAQLLNQVQSQQNVQLIDQLQNQQNAQLINQMQAQQNEQSPSQPNTQLPNQIQNQTNTQLTSQLQSQPNLQLTQQMQNQPNAQLINQIQSQPNTQLTHQMQNQSNTHLINQIQSQPNTQLTHQMQNQPNAQSINQMQSQQNVQLTNQVQTPQSAQVSNQQIPQSNNQMTYQQNTQLTNQSYNQLQSQLQPVSNQSYNQIQSIQNQLTTSAQYPTQPQLVNQGYNQVQSQPVINQNYDQVISAQSQPAVNQNYNQPQPQTAFVTPTQSQLLNQGYNPMQSQSYNQPQEPQRNLQPQSIANSAYKPSQIIHTNDSNQVSQLVFNKAPEETPQTQRPHHVLHENMLALQYRPQVMPQNQQAMLSTGDYPQLNIPQMNAGDMPSSGREIKLKQPEIKEERTDGIDRAPRTVASPRTANPLEETITRYGYPAQKPRQASFV